MYADNVNTIWQLFPEMILVLLASWMIIGATFSEIRWWWCTFALLGYAVAMWNMSYQDFAFMPLFETGGSKSYAMLTVDMFGHGLRWLAVGSGFLFTLMSLRTANQRLAGEFYGLLMLLVTGIMLAARANDLALLFVSLELISIPTYVLLFLGRSSRSNSEATAKYFFLSVLSSAILLYGFSFLYGLAGTTTIVSSDGAAVQGLFVSGADGSLSTTARTLLPIALVLIVSGLGFKMAAVPFHFYAPDVYQGTTNLNAGLLAIAPKIAGVVALVRLLLISLPTSDSFGWRLVIVVAIVTMTLGNVCALWQKNIRRLMAYSSIAHSGYLLIGLAVALAAAQLDLGSGGVSSMVLYLFVYALASIGTFSALTFLGSEEAGIDSIEDLAGLAKAQPVAAGAVAICMFSLAGLPPLAGFWGKFGLFSGAINLWQDATDTNLANWFLALAIVGAINAAIAAAYYLRVVATMYFQSSTSTPAANGGEGAWLAMALCAIGVVVCGVLPGRLVSSSNLAGRAITQQSALSQPNPSSDPNKPRPVVTHRTASEGAE